MNKSQIWNKQMKRKSKIQKYRIEKNKIFQKYSPKEKTESETSEAHLKEEEDYNKDAYEDVPFIVPDEVDEDNEKGDDQEVTIRKKSNSNQKINVNTLKK